MILQCNNLFKAYKKNVFVINNLNLTLPKGRIIGLLGPNGCGKSTLIKMIAGVLQPTKGSILVDGKEVGHQSKAVVSYLPERPYFDPAMKVSELLRYFEEFYEDFDRERANRLLRDLSIDPEAKLKILSKGTKEKVQLILVMSRKAKLYLLDEPIAGVDPAAREYILSTIVSNYDSEATILITTHLITDVEQVLDEFIFFSWGGRVLKSGNADEERTRSGMSLDELFKEVYRCSQSF